MVAGNRTSYRCRPTPYHVGNIRSELWSRFGPTRITNFHEELSKIRQTGTFREYQRAFERLRNKVSNWLEEALVGTFLGGLHPNIGDDVRMFQPKTLEEVINLARMKDDQLQKQKRPFTPRNQPYSAPPSKAVTTTIRPAQAPRKLSSWEEMKRKRALGLCFSCDEKYAPGHKCVNPQIFIMEGIDESDSDGANAEEDDTTPEITLNALTGWDSPTTMRLLATIADHNLHALVDSSSTHNFISEKVALNLKLQETPSKPFDVRVANGTPLRCQRRFDNVNIQIGGTRFRVTLYALPLVGLDLVMGIQWLQSLEPVLIDWKAHTLKLDWDGKTHTLHGLKQNKIQPTCREELAKEVRQGHFLFALCSSENPTEPKELNDDMRLVLNDFTGLFQFPDGLPPTR